MISFDAKFNTGRAGLPRTSHLPGPAAEDLQKTKASAFKAQLFEFSSGIRAAAGRDFEDQAAVFRFDRLPRDIKDRLTYEGRPIAELSSGEAAGLVAGDGFFGVAKTSGRIIDFVVGGAGDDLGRLRAGREGVVKGFKAAEELWGGQLPAISYETLEKSLEAIDEKINELGGSVVDLTA